MTVEAILRFKSPYDDPATSRETLNLMADYANATYGEGGDRLSANIEGVICECNTPPQGGYVRVQVSEYYAHALEYLEEFYPNQYASLIWVGWPAEYDADGNQTNGEPVIDWAVLDEAGVEIGRQGLGRFA